LKNPFILIAAGRQFGREDMLYADEGGVEQAARHLGKYKNSPRRNVDPKGKKEPAFLPLKKAA
jgi:hypothetical protein